MAKNVMRKNLSRSIRKSIGRYLAIVGIIALGAAMFVGLRTTKSDMVLTGQVFTDEQNMHDFQLLSTYAWTAEQVEKIAGLDGVVDAEGGVTLDVIAQREESDKEFVYKFHTIPKTVDKVYLLAGRMPSAPNECLFDGFHGNEGVIGLTMTVSPGNSQETLDALTEHTFTVVGLVSTPIYMDMTRGNTTLGNGTVTSYIYIPSEAVDMDYFTEVNITIPGDNVIYSEDFDSLMNEQGARLEKELLPLAQERMEALRQEALDTWEEGKAEYEDGLAKFLEGEQEALAELADAKQQLTDAQNELEENRQLLVDGLAEIEAGQAEIDKNRKDLENGEYELKKAKQDAQKQMDDAYTQLLENYKLLTENEKPLADGIAQIKDGLSQLDTGIAQLQGVLNLLQSSVDMYQGLVDMAAASEEAAEQTLQYAKDNGAGPITVAGLERTLESIRQERQRYETQLAELKAGKQEYDAQLAELEATRSQLQSQLDELQAQQDQMDDAKAAIDAGFIELEEQRALAEEEFAKAEQQLSDGRYQLNKAQKTLDEALAELQEGQKALQEGEVELADAWKQYYKGEAEAMAELDKARAELTDAKAQLDDGLERIEAMSKAEVFVLDRNKNVGYLSLDSNSDIVQGISAVFPAFFLLIAALVCITTMTRMVEEERTQIGTLKALGYSSGAIIGKYLAYAGSAAVIGCGLGVLLGSVIFPLILWKAYGIIMLLTPDLILRIDWPLCLMVVGMYTAVTLLVTWYCCHKTLKEVPAELIRPKPPVTGRKILLEYLPFWDKISFLNKVTWRNIFRYRQRLLMMLIGIGGCTALLLTGFGVRDSIVDIVDIQFENVTKFDLEVRFTHHMTEEDRQRFEEKLGSGVGEVGFYHQSSVEMDFEDQTSDVILIASESHIGNFLDFHDSKGSLSFPPPGDALLSIGIAQKLGIEVGDTILIRNSDMKSMQVRISGIFENNVYNYVVTSPKTVEAQWGSLPDVQMGCVRLNEGQDNHAVGARISEMAGVMNVTVNEDLAEMVGSMLEALNLVVATVIVCAGALAFIVLYNLTNINITERIREIATIKVLGFHEGESAMYVFKENLILSAMGAVLGLGGGWLLLKFVMSQIKVDMVWMSARLLPISYVLAIVLTMVFACMVDFLLYFKLKKINMAEALKSVE